MNKLFDTMRARCALGGLTFNVIESDDGKPLYVVSRWNITRQFNDLNELGEWLHRVAGR